MTDTTALARRYRLEVNLGTDAAPDWQVCPGVFDFKPAEDPTHQDDSDYEGGGWKKKAKTALDWKVEVKIRYRANQDTGVFNPVHTKLRTAARSFGSASLVSIRYFDRDGKDDAWQGTALVDWKPEGGEHDQLDHVTVTLDGSGELAAITNPLNENPDPIVVSVSPNSGAAAGGELVTITGAYFTGATAVTFDGTPATDFQVVDSTSIAAITPAGLAGPADVAVTTPDGTGTGTGVYTYS